MQEIKLLIIDDDHEDFELLEESLLEIKNYKFDITWVSNHKLAIEKISSDTFDVYIIDYLLGAYSGLDICKIIRDAEIQAPIILLTGKGDPEVDRKASELGVNDYLVKSTISATELERSIRYALKNSDMLLALKISEKKYRSVLRHSKDILFITDLNFKIISISDSIKKITGYSATELGKEGLLHIFHDNDFIKFLKERIANKNGVFNKMAEIFAKNGEKKTIVLSCNYEHDLTQGDFLHGIIIDKTEEIRSQQIRLVYEKLESTARLMRTLAHEVRNPLNNISLALEGIESEEIESPYLPIISRNADRIENILKKVLNFAHIENTTMSMGNFIDVVLQTIENIRDKADLLEITISTELPTNYSFLLHQEQLSLALTNILVNALEALENIQNGKIEIILSGNKLKIIDNGPGISKEDQKVIFEPYFTKKKNGIGLGLASSMSIFKTQGIETELDSSLGNGATFILTLPKNTEI
ncbi:hybrid sensor histidine kinase/response regulator [Lacihabitans sp. LS3-19]|uniref:hybrid sensor histidine kinase/response regulator n=1 Tax=Lacihabitans sp. LS3-19 TaxID=2487335 RepID=UPI0020CCC7BA|nr:hybrid sensor histidine kinase/response regulator [Lacihabitans sp. LS3-19]MCP9768939.1 hybrid sensor histidine kinase/response regulator [Lacihabitans sp. LS3-19]